MRGIIRRFRTCIGACVRAARGEGLIQIQGPLSIPGMTENRCCRARCCVRRAGTPLVIAVLLHLKLVVTPKRYSALASSFHVGELLYGLLQASECSTLPGILYQVC